jgi:hypothetical protein
MNTEASFKNQSLLKDIVANFYPEGRYHFQVQQNTAVNFILSIYPHYVNKIDDNTPQPVGAYHYQTRKDIIHDLDQWLSYRGLFTLRAIVKTIAQPATPTLKATFDDGKTMPEEMSEILNCIKFQNREAECIYQNNIYGMLGDKTHHEQARRMQYTDWLLNTIYQDCQVFVKPHADKFKTGKGGNHVWIAENDERILMIHL